MKVCYQLLMLSTLARSSMKPVITSGDSPCPPHLQASMLLSIMLQ